MDQRVERPLVYVAQSAPEQGGEDVLATLREGVLGRALGLNRQVSGSRTEDEVDTGGAVLQSLQRLLSRLSHFSDSSEMALVGMVPLGDRDRPLLVFHTRLRAEGVAEMRELLDKGGLAEPGAVVHGQQVYRFKAGSSQTGPVEIALVDRDMLVSNDHQTMVRVLDPTTSASGGFARDPRFTRLRRKLTTPPGSLLFYADWKALAPSLDQAFCGDATWLMSLSGVQRPEQLMIVARPAPRKANQKRGILSSIVLHHGGPSYTFGTASAENGVKGKGGAATWRADGWLDLLTPASAKDLIPKIPPGGVLSVAALLDLKRVLPTHRGRQMRRLQATIFHACRRFGIDLRREVLRRLSPSAGVQLLSIGAAEGPASGEGIRVAWSIRAKSTHDAKELFDLFQRILPRSGAALQKGTAVHPELHFENVLRGAGNTVVLARVRDALVVAFDPAVIAQMRKSVDAGKRSPQSRRSASELARRLQRLGVRRQDEVAGVFGLDLGAFDPDAADRKAGEELSGLFGLHGGSIRFEQEFVRLEVFTELQSP